MRLKTAICAFAFAGMTVGAQAQSLLWSNPAGGWTYAYEGNSAAAGSGGYTALDGLWNHDNGSDEWDGSGIGSGKLGGIQALTDGPTNYVRIQDVGDPRDAPAGQGDPGSNRKIYLTRLINNEIPANYNILDQGVTVSFRARLSSSGPLDVQNPDAGSGTEPGTAGAAWPASGNGYLNHDGGKGIFGIRQKNGDKMVSFSLATDADKANGGGNANVGAGLVMNSLNGTTPNATVDPFQNEGSLNVLGGFNPLDWHEFWITIVAGGAGTHLVTVYLDGSLVPAGVFNITAGEGNEQDENYIALGLGGTQQMGAVDVDFFSYKVGVVAPVPEPGSLGLAALGGLWLLRRRRTL